LFYIKNLSSASSLERTIPVFIWVLRKEKLDGGFLIVSPLKCSRAMTILHVKVYVSNLVSIQRKKQGDQSEVKIT
jgi:hypothetical protein